MNIHQAELINVILQSLQTIRTANEEISLLSVEGASTGALSSQIELCDTLLNEVRVIHNSLSRRVRDRRWSGAHAMPQPYDRRTGHLPAMAR